MTRRIGISFLLLLLAALFVVPSVSGFYTDWLWFRELQYDGVFLRTLNAEGMVFAATCAAVFLFLFGNFTVARRSLRRPVPVVVGTGPDGRPITLEVGTLGAFAVPVAAVLSVLFGLSGANNWLGWLSFFNGVSFGERDPLFGRDVAFYVFRLPMWQSVREQALLVTLLTLIGCGLLYVLSGSFVIAARRGGAWPTFQLLPSARRHLSLITALLFGLMAWGCWLTMAQTLISPAGVVFGASYTDVHANLPFLRINLAVLIVGAGLAVWHGFARRAWAVPLAIGLYLASSIIGGLYAGFVQSFVVSPNESAKELPYIQFNIAATRKAYALDRVEEKQISGDAELTPAQIVGNVDTIENVRLWDHLPLLQTFSQIQEIRTYYDFINVDNDRYQIDGKYRQVMLSARELNTESLPQHGFVNERLTFTHGYGLTLGPVNQVTTDGLPVLFIRDLPPVTTVNLPVDEPSIYFGELSNDYVLVGTNTEEFHFPRGNDNVTTKYHGSGGVVVGGFFRRLMFALRFGTTDILVTSQINPDSRILFHRKIAERVRTLAPFLSYDADPYPVLSHGRLYWIQDAYTTTSNYPYSTQYGDASRAGTAGRSSFGVVNYIRNSVKVVIDAYNGTTSFYVAEPADPLVLTISKIFPGLLRPLDEMPADLRQHIRYPEDIFRVQSAIYTTFHMTNPSVFYNKEDEWQVPALDTGGNAVPMQPYYTIMRLPGEKKAEFVQILPFTPRSKANLSAWMVARSDQPRYGHMLVFQFPKQKIIYGPQQIIGRINQDPVISPQISLWNQQGSEVIWGTPLVIPIEESLLYVRPLYLRSPEGKIPELKRVIVAYQSKIVMAETLTAALTQIFGPSVASALPVDRLRSSATSVVPSTSEAPAAPAPAGEAPQGDLAAEAQLHYERAQKALRESDFTAFDKEWKAMGDVLSRMQKNKK